MLILEPKRKAIEDCLRTKFKSPLDIYWWDGFRGNQIIEVVILPYGMHIKVEIDSLMFIDNDVHANVDFILYYVRRSILDNFLVN